MFVSILIDNQFQFKIYKDYLLTLLYLKEEKKIKIS